MPMTPTTCEQTCKGLCRSLEAATIGEQKSIAMYERLRDQCTYPDVRIMLGELIEHRRQILLMIEATQRRLQEKFDVLDQVRESFETL